jgi:hypothetical protein
VQTIPFIPRFNHASCLSLSIAVMRRNEPRPGGPGVTGLPISGTGLTAGCRAVVWCCWAVFCALC